MKDTSEKERKRERERRERRERERGRERGWVVLNTNSQYSKLFTMVLIILY